MQLKYLIPIASWSALGFYRGVQMYDNVKFPSQRYMYTESFAFGLGGVLLYSVPPFTVAAIYNEVYALEYKMKDDK